ncbi:hypothetical protein [Fredinandcohnia sp. 179-A 10B2 NHS]|uniref:hypothetical protein n=1 Tax=Fredinandcohnia sp. 179-A 10B2 NHS TaxID=3235176 RepID=UPI00399F2DB5
MKKIIVLLSLSLILVLISITPLFQIAREMVVGQGILDRYEIHHAYKDDQGWEDIVDTQELHIQNVMIEIIEVPTGKKAPLTPWDEDENVPPGDIVDVHILVNGEEITEPAEIWLSNRARGSRYFSWLDVVTVKDRETDKTQINIIQRLTDDDQPMEDRKWKIISISENGEKMTEEILTYKDRSENKLGVRLVNFTNTGLMSMGYYSDITHGYPSLFFPFLYPMLTCVVGIVLLIISSVRLYKRRG